MSFGPVDLGSFTRLGEGCGYGRNDSDVLSGKIGSLKYDMALNRAIAEMYVRGVREVTPERAKNRNDNNSVTVDSVNDAGQKSSVCRYMGDLAYCTKDSKGIRVDDAATVIRNGQKTKSRLADGRLMLILGFYGMTQDSNGNSQIIKGNVAEAQHMLGHFANSANRRCHLWSVFRQVGLGGALAIGLSMAMRRIPVSTRWVLLDVGCLVVWYAARENHRNWAEFAGFCHAASLGLAGRKCSKGRSTPIYEGQSGCSNLLRELTDSWAVSVKEELKPKGGNVFQFPKGPKDQAFATSQYVVQAAPTSSPTGSYPAGMPEFPPDAQGNVGGGYSQQVYHQPSSHNDLFAGQV